MVTKDADSHDAAQPWAYHTSFEARFGNSQPSDDPNIRGGELSGEPQKRIDLSSSDPLRTPGVVPITRRQDSMATPWMNQGANPSIPTYGSVYPQRQHVNPHVPLDDHSLPSLTTTTTSTGATGDSLNTVPTSGAQGMGGAVSPGNNAALVGVPSSSQEPTHGPVVNGTKAPSAINQTQKSAPRSATIPAPAPGGPKPPNLGHNNWDAGVSDWITLIKPLPQANESVIILRRETQVTLDINFDQILMMSSITYSGIKIPATDSVGNDIDPTGRTLLEFRIHLYGATTLRRYESVCASCKKRYEKKKGVPSLIDFKTEGNVISPKDGKIRIEFVFCCYPKDHQEGDGEYLVEAMLSEYAGQNRPIAQRRFPFSFNVEDQSSQGQTTPLRKTQGGRELGQLSRTPSETEKPNIQPQIDDPPQGYPSTKPAIDLQGSLQGDQHGVRKPPISSDLPLLPQLLRKASANPTPPNAPSNQAAAPPKRLDKGTKTNAEVYPPGKGSSVQVAPGEQFSVPGPDEANDSGHGQSGSNTGAPTSSRGRSTEAESKMGSRGRSSQVPPGPKEAEIRLDSRIPPNIPSDTATRTTDLDKAKESRHARPGSNPVAETLNDVSAIQPVSPPPPANEVGSRGRSSQVPPDPKEAEIKLDSRIPPTTPPNTASSGVDKMVRHAATTFASRGRGVTPHPGGSGGENGSNTSTIDDVESLRKGMIKTSKNKAKTPYTILLIGETGVGKSSVLELIANVLASNDIDNYNLDILDHTNEHGDFQNQSRTNEAHLYKFTSKNGVGVEILDTPGLADTRGIQQDGIHKWSIATQIKNHIDSVTAVIVVANGAVSGVTIGTDYVFSTLSTIFPKSLAGNIAFMFTNDLSSRQKNLSGDTIPDVLKTARQFHLDNPIVLQKEYLKVKNGPGRANLRNAVKASDQSTLGMLVDLFDWLDGLRPQPVKDVVSLHERSQAIETKVSNVLARKWQAATIQAEIEEQKGKLQEPSLGLSTFSNFKKTVDIARWEKQPANKDNYLCSEPGCHSTCDANPFVAWFQRLFRRQCAKCAHPHRSHSHTRHEWVKVTGQETLIDEGMQKEWETAKAEKDGAEEIIATKEKDLGELNRIIHNDMDELARLVDGYTGLSLSESFSVHVEKAIRLYRDMEEKELNKEQSTGSLDLMKKKLELLQQAEKRAKARKHSGNSGL